VGVPIFSASRDALGAQLAELRRHAESLGSETGLTARTTRLTLPDGHVDEQSHPGTLRSVLARVRALADVLGARWYCLPVDLFRADGRGAVLDELQTLLLRDDKLFVNLIAAHHNAISMEGASLAARFIQGLARRSPTGIDNFRVGVSAACPPGAPFFPFSRHDGDRVAFSLAMESTGVALEAAAAARAERLSLTAFQDRFVASLKESVRRVDAFGRLLEQRCGALYRGLDASLAPFPDGKNSVGRIIELLGPTPVGVQGTIFATSVLTDAIKSAILEANVRAVGFNGVMFSVMEDDVLAQSISMRGISLEKLAAFSTVCACGIDMVPVPGSMFAEDLTCLILDISALAVRLSKPLGVRVLPIPQAAANDFTQLNLDFICDSRVIDPGIGGSRPLLTDPTWRFRTSRRENND
jgi:uncharacterized protein (UPF0210 family)